MNEANDVIFSFNDVVFAPRVMDLLSETIEFSLNVSVTKSIGH